MCTFLIWHGGNDMSKSNGSAGEWNLDSVVAALNARHQRASYKAVADMLGQHANQLMQGRPRNPLNSWVVASSTCKREGRRLGWPTGYIDPECARQIEDDPDNFIRNADELREWLEDNCANRRSFALVSISGD